MRGQIFEYALAHGKVKRNPCKDIKPSIALKPRWKEHFARVDVAELPELLRKIAAYPAHHSPDLPAMQLVTLTFVRTRELVAAWWEEFDLDAAEWRIPAARMKMMTPHIVPPSRQALDVLRCLRELRSHGLLFPGERDHDKPMSNGTILGALRRMDYAGRMTGHGFRRSGIHNPSELAFDHAHIELQLAHMERDDISAPYNFATTCRQGVA
jgi:integrase